MNDTSPDIIAKIRAEVERHDGPEYAKELLREIDRLTRLVEASAPTPEPQEIKELNQAALDLAEQEYWRDNGDARHNLATAILVYLNAR